MPVSCTPQDLVTGASCFYCKVPDLESVEIALLCAMAGGTPYNPDGPTGDPITIDMYITEGAFLLDELGNPVLGEDGNPIILESGFVAPVVTVTSNANPPSLSWTQGFAPATNAIWRKQNAGAWTLLATQAGSLTTYTDPTPVPALSTWSYKIIPSTGSESGQIDVNNSVSLTPPVSDLPYFVAAYGYIDYTDYFTLTTVNYPKLKYIVDTFYMNPGHILASVSMPELVSVGDDFLFSQSPMAVLSFPNLQTVGGNLDCFNCAGLTTLNLPALASVGGEFNVGECFALTSITLTSLQTVAAGFHIKESLLTSISLPALTSLGAVSSDWTGCTGLTTVSFPLLIFQNGQQMYLQGCALTAASVNHILARAVASGVTSLTLDLSNVGGGSSAAPTGQGIIDKAALILAGNTITTA